jgi:hypothetical protein
MIERPQSPPESQDKKTQEWSAQASLTFNQNTPPPRTRGEKIFNTLSWALFGWLANAAVSIQLADILENRFRPLYLAGGKAIAKSPVFTHFFKGKEQEAGTLARSLFSVIALLPGGYTVLAPIKWMEDRKVSMVKTLDNWFGKKNPDENTKQLIEARHSYLEAAPKLNWWDMIKGRTLPVLGIVATHFAFASDKTNIVNIAAGKPVFKGLNYYIGECGAKLHNALKHSRFSSIRSATNNIEQGLDNSLQNHIQRNGVSDYITDGKKRSGSDRLRGYLNNVSVDIIYSAAVAGATYVFGHLSAFKREEKKDAAYEGTITPREKHKFHLESSPNEPALTIPTTQLNNIHHDSRINPQETLQHAL